MDLLKRLEKMEKRVDSLDSLFQPLRQASSCELFKEDDLESRLLEQIKAERIRKALKKANAEIQPLRQAEKERLLKEDESITRAIADLQLKAEAIRTKREAVMRGEFDTVLTAGVVQQASQVQLTNNVSRVTPKERPEKRERTLITRPPLKGLIKSKSQFRFSNKGKVYTCWTEDGGIFTDGDGIYKSLASWTSDVIERGGGGGRKVSAYEVCEIFLNSEKVWKKWGEIYKPDTTKIN